MGQELATPGIIGTSGREPKKPRMPATHCELTNSDQQHDILNLHDFMLVEEDLRELEMNLKDSASRLVAAQEKERRRIARELHDELGQSLLVLKLRVSAVEKNLQVAKSQCEGMYSYLDEIVENVRRLSRDLSPHALEDLGLSAAIRHLVSEFNKHYGIVDCRLAIDQIDDLFIREDQLHIYRVIQECLTNIGKYANATKVRVIIRKQKDNVFIKVQDNGIGFNLDQVLSRDAKRRGLGLDSLGERVRIIGGAIKIWSQIGQGTRISFKIPIDSVEEAPGE